MYSLCSPVGVDLLEGKLHGAVVFIQPLLQGGRGKGKGRGMGRGKVRARVTARARVGQSKAGKAIHADKPGRHACTASVKGVKGLDVKADV